MKWQDGIVRWFDNKSGDGIIRVGKKSIYVHWGAIASELNGPENCFKNPKKLWCVLFKKQQAKSIKEFKASLVMWAKARNERTKLIKAGKEIPERLRDLNKLLKWE